jgi:hypothetical protein
MKLRYKYLLCASTLAALLLLIIGAGWTEQPPRGAVQTAPIVAGLIPNEIVAGSPGFTLTVSGAFFANGCVVRWNGADRPTSFVNGTVLQVQVPAGDVAASGTAGVSAANPAAPNEHAGVSNVLAFRILPAASF